MFTDRDGKYQLGALAESGFDPLARTCRFMLTEEAHHLSVGESGVERVLRRAAQLTKLDKNGDARAQGGVDLPTVQKWIRYWFSYSIDLFGSEISTNAADYFGAGLKGRWREEKDYEEHTALDQIKVIPQVQNGAVKDVEVPLRNGMNEVLRDAYIADCDRVVRRWNKALEEEGVDFQVELPHRRVFRRQGVYSDHHFDPQGNLIDEAAWNARVGDWLPTQDDREYLASLMNPVHEAGKMAQWVAAPRRGIDGHPVEFEYVRV
jgi:benzoyl-CoA 2,3-dioxygenase component B